MRNGGVVTVTLVLLILLSGCNSLFQGSSPRGNYDVPDRTTVTPEPRAFAPGLDDEDGVVAPYDLASAHGRALESRSFTFQRDLVVTASNGTILREDRLGGRVEANRTRFVVSAGHWQLGRQWEYDRYWSGSAGGPVLGAKERADGTEYVAYRDPGNESLRLEDVISQDGTFRNRLYRILSTVAAANVTVTNGSANPEYVVRVQRVTDTWLIRDVENGTVSDVSIILVVDADGLIKRLYLEYQLNVDGERVRIDEVYRFDAVGQTAVAPPTWSEGVRSSVETENVNRSRDSVDGPMVASGGTEWDSGNESRNESDSRTPLGPSDGLGATTTDRAPRTYS